jgi:hypothetical protein
MLMLAVMGLVSQAQNDMAKTGSQTELTEKTRRTMWKLAQELSETSFDMVIAGGRNLAGTNPGEVTNYVQSTNESNMVQCPDDECPWHFNVTAGTHLETRVQVSRRVMVKDGSYDPTDPAASISATDTSVTGRIWVGRQATTVCPAGHTITATLGSTVDLGMIMFASPRNRNGRFVSAEGSDLGTDWQSLVFYVPFSVGGNVTELRRYVVYADDLISGADGVTAWTDASGQGWVAPPANESHTHTGAGAGGNAFATNNPAGKPTITGLLDYDGDDSIADGILDVAAGGTADATEELLELGGTNNGSIVYTKKGGAGTFDFQLLIDRRTGDITLDVDHDFGGGDTYVRRVVITGRQPETIASRITDLEFATIRNCPFQDDNTADVNDENETGMLVGQDSTTIRITALFDKMLGRQQDATSGTQVIERQLTSQDLVVTRVQPRT